ncbi:MAG TPA: serine--tRNA ligase [Pseudobdellovibrionaceae bacterium]|nr:serine--tRNA ligase [Pseudobdellovibrionaceae bacterium]
MLDIKFIRENPDIVRKAIEQKRVKLNLDELLSADSRLMELKKRNQALNEERNANSKKMKGASPQERDAIIARGREIGQEIDALKADTEAAELALQNLLWLVPLPASPDTPIGLDESGNQQVRTWGAKPKFEFKPLDHVEILQKRDWAELERIATVSGSRSYSLKGDLVILEHAMLRYGLEKLRAKGFTLISVPAMAREHAFVGTGHFPTGREQVYHLKEDDIYLAGTAEVPINSLHTGEILGEAQLPILYGGVSPCFRREAGSAGRDVRGLIRVHQFNKVEQYILCKNDPAESERLHQLLLATSEEILQDFELHYQVVAVCTGDMGAGKFKMFDIETWVPSENLYRETHSCSNLHDWQARRSNLRYRDEGGTVRFCHTLNNTAIATPRILVPFLEQHQQANGRIRIPPALRNWMGGASEL